MTARRRRQLDEQGYVLLENVMGPASALELRERILELYDEKGSRPVASSRPKRTRPRLANLVDKGEVFRRAIVAARRARGRASRARADEIKLSSLNARSADPGSTRASRSTSTWAPIPDERGYWVCNTVWMLDDFTAENGATRMIPGSHHWRKRPQDVLDDPMAPHPHEVLLTGKAGSIAVMNAHLWHGGTANRTAAPRLALHAFYCRRDKPQQQYQKALLRPELQASSRPRCATCSRSTIR